MKILKTFERFNLELIREFTDNNFSMPKETQLDLFKTELFKKYLPNSFETNYESKKRLSKFVGGNMFVHVFYIIFDTPDGELFLHNTQYWLSKENVNVTAIHMKLNNELIGDILVDTDILLKKDLKDLESNYKIKKSS